MSKKYPISREFFPLTHFAAPIDPRVFDVARKFMGVPKFVWRDTDLSVGTLMVPGYKSGEVEVLIMLPRGLATPAPCLIDFHGGGFVFEAAWYQYRLAMQYAKQARCIVAFVRYRLAPQFPFPYPQEDCYSAASWIHECARELGIDRSRIGLCGDSAGGTLTATTSMMLRDRNAQLKPLFQLLIYPWLDNRNESESYRKFDDVPMWNSTKSQLVDPLINPNPAATPLAYRSPTEAESFADLPAAYIEVAEFDSLHDDGILYAQLLRDSGVDAECHETRGTIHGFDAKLSAPTTKQMVAERVTFMKRMFWG